jgi:hypothetical protein
MYDSGAGSGGGNSRRYWRDGKLYSTYSDPEYGHLMRDSFGNWIPDTRWQTLPTRALNNVGNFLGDAMVGGLKGVQAAEGWLDDRYEDVVDFFDRDRYASSGPLARRGYRHHPGVPVPLDEYPSRHANPHAQVTIDNTPSHLIPGYDRMVNEGYDSWSPSDDNRSDWQKWKDSVNSGRR